MRVVFDIQAAQNANRHRGIGRYVRSLAKALAADPQGNEIIFLLSAAFPDTIGAVRAEIESAAGPQDFRTFFPFDGISTISGDDGWRRRASAAVRDAAIASCRPDCVLVGSVFDGFADESVVSVHDQTIGAPVAVIAYDLIPLAHPEHYLSDKRQRRWYFERLSAFRRADAWLAISEYSTQDAIQRLGLPHERCVNVGAAVDFGAFDVAGKTEPVALSKFGITRPFIMYAGAADWRKNIEGLIDAYCDLPNRLRTRFQLVLACALDSAHVSALKERAAHRNAAEDVIITGYVSDNVLSSLYRTTSLFVMPSRFEGFGLPPLEAMAHGAPSIAADNTSLPEIIGRADALFSLESRHAMRNKIAEVLEEASFSEELRLHGVRQAAKFSWEKTANVTWKMLQKTADGGRVQSPFVNYAKPKLAFVSPLPPTPSGISDYSADILPELARFYDIDIVTPEPPSIDSGGAWSSRLTHDQFANKANEYDRVLYQFGNSPFHLPMFDLIERHPGVITLHDFYLPWPYLVAAQSDGRSAGKLVEALHHSGGFSALRDLYNHTTEDVARAEACNLPVLQAALGVILHSRHSLALAEKFYRFVDHRAFAIVPFPRTPMERSNRLEARRALGISEGDFIVVSFGSIAHTKLSKDLFTAFIRSKLAAQPNAQLVFVGSNDGGPYGESLAAEIESTGARVRITGRIDHASYLDWAAAADIGVQLRIDSRGETSAAAFDCLNAGVPTIVNGCGSMKELPSDCVLMLDEAVGIPDLSVAIDSLCADKELRSRLSENSRKMIRSRHLPRHSADAYYLAIEEFYRHGADSTILGARRFASKNCQQKSDMVESYAEKATLSAPPAIRNRQILCDCSYISEIDLETGIQRVIRNILRRWLVRTASDGRAELVKCRVGEDYRYGHSLALKWLGLPSAGGLDDEPVDVAPGDIFIVFDSAWDVYSDKASYYSQLRALGCKVFFVVYDLLPFTAPQFFPDFAVRSFNRMLQSLKGADGAFCISRSVAMELRNWMTDYAPDRLDDFQIEWFHLGADLDGPPAIPAPLPPDLGTAMARRTTILMVGTVEPRKGHKQAVAAFDALWRRDIDINLVIVGKTGWAMEKFSEEVRSNSQFRSRLFWFDSAGDDLLAAIYENSDAVLIASEGEGFGLPIVEAGVRMKPVIARDLPVFREVAGDSATYFDGIEPESLAEKILAWLESFKKAEHRQPEKMVVHSWDESADQLWGTVIRMAENSKDGLV